MGTLSKGFDLIKSLAFLLLAATVLAEPEPTAVADPSAEAKADPYLLYGGYYGYPYAYGGYYGHLGYGGYWGRKRRSAEAEPAAEPEANPDADPKADPYLLYGGYYGYGHGLYGGYHGYPYAYWG